MSSNAVENKVSKIVVVKAGKSEESKSDTKPEKKEKVVKTKTPKVKKEKVAKRKPGPAMSKFKFKADKVQGQCDVLGCKAKAHSPKGFRCKPHKKQIRKAQLAANNVVWRKRVAAGTAGHHVVYTSPLQKKMRLTKWAKQATEKAEAIVKKEASIVSLDEFRKLKVAEAESAKKAKAKVLKTKKAAK